MTTCKKHPNYKVLRRPQDNCKACHKMWDEKRQTLILGYEFMYTEYKQETRRRPPDQYRLSWFKDHLANYQSILRTMFTGEDGLEFTEL